MVTMDLTAILLVIQIVSVAIKIMLYAIDVKMIVTMETTAPVIAVIIV